MSSRRFIYLHGFASGAGSRKANFFRQKLFDSGVSLEIPDLTARDFENLTIGRQLNVIQSLIQEEPAILIGSSMGGYLAALYAARHHSIQRLLLLAPAFRFAGHWRETIGSSALEKWKQDGVLPVYHHTEKRLRNLRYGIVDESALWEEEPGFPQPALIFHGTEDAVVPVQFSEEYASDRDNVKLITLKSGHELTDVLEDIWAASRDFLLAS